MLERGPVAASFFVGDQRVRAPWPTWAPASDDHTIKSPQTAYGFDINASVRVPGHDRKRLERLVRYIGRPPVANDRPLERLADGRFRLRLKSAWSDGTTHIILEGFELIGRLVALVPPPRRHQVRFHGVFALNAKLRRAIVPRQVVYATSGSPDAPSKHNGVRQRISWTELMQRVFDSDVTRCPRCHQTGMQRIASIVRQDAIKAILIAFPPHATAPPSSHRAAS